MTGPDLLVRTSGEVRLSDFLLWQSSYSVTHFTQVLWPEFSLWHLLAAVFHYQSKQLYIQELFSQAKPDDQVDDNSDHRDKRESQEAQERIAKFLRILDKETTHTANNTDYSTSHKSRSMTSLES